jgi:hypothetical protein
MKYNPMINMPEQLENLYLCLSIQNAAKFEESQIQQLARTSVCVIEIKSFELEEKVQLNKGPVFQYNEKENRMMEKTETFKGIAYVPYNLRPNTVGCVDLNQKRNGANRTIFGILAESTVTEADAASVSLGPYTFKVFDNSPVKLYYNEFELAKIDSGLCDNGDKNDYIESTFLYLNLLKLASKYNIIATTAKVKFENLYNFLVKEQYKEGLLGCLTGDLYQNISQLYDNLVGELDPKIKNNYPTGQGQIAERYYNYFSPKINSFLISTNTIFDQYLKKNTLNQTEIIKLRGCLDKIYKLLYKQLCEEIDLELIAKDLQKQTISETTGSQYGGEINTNVESIPIISSNLLLDTPLQNAYSYGHYLVLENGSYVGKNIESEEELQQIKILYNVIPKEKAVVAPEPLPEIPKLNMSSSSSSKNDIEPEIVKEQAIENDEKIPSKLPEWAKVVGNKLNNNPEFQKLPKELKIKMYANYFNKILKIKDTDKYNDEEIEKIARETLMEVDSIIEKDKNTNLKVIAEMKTGFNEVTPIIQNDMNNQPIVVGAGKNKKNKKKKNNSKKKK